MMWYFGTGWGGVLGMTLGMLLWLAIFGLLIWGLTSLITDHKQAPVQGLPSAMEILRQRYARGEIDEAAYRTMRDQLQSQPGSDSERH